MSDRKDQRLFDEVAQFCVIKCLFPQVDLAMSNALVEVLTFAHLGATHVGSASYACAEETRLQQRLARVVVHALSGRATLQTIKEKLLAIATDFGPYVDGDWRLGRSLDTSILDKI